VARMEVHVEFNGQDRYGRIVGRVFMTPPDCPKCGKTPYLAEKEPKGKSKFKGR
jgi:hypothetical protein